MVPCVASRMALAARDLEPWLEKVINNQKSVLGALVAVKHLAA